MTAFIAFIAGEHIQIRSLQMDSMAEEFFEIALYIIGSLAGAQITLPAACPARKLWHFSMDIMDRIFLIECGGIHIIIPVLVVNAEHITAFLHGIGKGLHAFPAACFFTGRKIIGVLIIVSRIAPAIQMQIQLLHALFFKMTDYYMDAPMVIAAS